MTTRPAPPRPAIPDAILTGRLIVVGRRLEPAGIAAIAGALVEAGIHVFEVTLNSPGALEAIALLRARFEPNELLVGAGTVLDTGNAERAVEAGARFIVMPHTDVEIVHWAAARAIPAFPGAFSPTEILQAWRAGASAVKLFPASVAGVAFVRECRGPLPEIPLIPTGGVTLEDAPRFLAAGAVAVGMGGWLTSDADQEGIRARGERLVAALAAANGNAGATDTGAGA